MTQIALFHFPGACSSVTRNALEEIGLKYDVLVVNIVAGEQKAQEYLSINPKGKVPALRIDDLVLSENAAILHHLNALFPQAGLLPREEAKLGTNRILQDLVWCSATLHPMTRQVRNPMRFTTGETNSVRTRGIELWQPVLKSLQEHFETSSWWYGENWSIIDVYLHWNYTTAAGGGLDLSGYPALARHADRVQSRPAFQQTSALDKETFERAGIRLPG
ncbi:glutathione S-transferase family protein [Rhodoblastus sp.]|uniref:glutathione S-transferase family protein n=1 Tax=Rhodoblastus sp. TaxID=1962975 RepID=UPI003F94BE76